MNKPYPDAPVFDEDETMSRDELTFEQINGLRRVVCNAKNVEFYREKLRDLEPEDIKKPDDLWRLPFTTKEDLRQNYPLKMLAVGRDKISRVHGSSGTTGKPTIVAYTENDVDTWANLCARFLFAGGLRSSHFAHIAFGLGMFTGGFGLHFGINRVGAAIVPAAAGNTRRQVMLLKDLAADALICTPSYALTIAETMREEGIAPDDLPLSLGFFGGEIWTEEMRARIEKELGVFATNNYGLSELIGPGVAGECRYRCGMHIQEDHFLVECLNPQTLKPVKIGEEGELVFTALTKEAMPIIRYRTRDIAALNYAPCECGRTGARMSRVRGRTDDMLIIRGVNVYPSQIEEAMLRVSGAVSPHYLIEVDRPKQLDVVTLKVELTPENFSDRMDEMQTLRDRIAREVQVSAQIGVNVELLAPQSLERAAGKAVRVLDKRNLNH
ncbi:MAG: phenylacetate--CoA ligase [Planctomycetota bacterium]|jgi:phenylacetate-CoA ligase|nr:phenylacetate--CoA ligase [Planctomycetota bacterium]